MLKKSEQENNKEKEEGSLKVYEVGYHIAPAVSAENLPVEVENLKNFLVKEGATIVSEGFPKMLDLSYAVSKSVGGSKRKFDTAYFGWIKFDAGEALIAKIKKFFDENENILRFLLIKTVKENTLFSPVSPKITASPAKEEPKTAKSSTEKEIKSPISQEELDKTIDKLIAE
ncbi:MAG: 30S ribosomal protein S6 [Patescibacteria group bacterium]|nr:30S ribosomal protein S6 [Patescibacteria group bacterium]MDE1988650.1 30S ribosomal protein S6 [Patescibacteria group bacterium]MDE2218114.1 30S ribosomal protein S6 [Patescibacteria group bacterium]